MQTQLYIFSALSPFAEQNCLKLAAIGSLRVLRQNNSITINLKLQNNLNNVGTYAEKNRLSKIGKVRRTWLLFILIKSAR